MLQLVRGVTSESHVHETYQRGEVLDNGHRESSMQSISNSHFGCDVCHTLNSCVSVTGAGPFCNEAHRDPPTAERQNASEQNFQVWSMMESTVLMSLLQESKHANRYVVSGEELVGSAVDGHANDEEETAQEAPGAGESGLLRRDSCRWLPESS